MRFPHLVAFEEFVSKEKRILIERRLGGLVFIWNIIYILLEK